MRRLLAILLIGMSSLALGASPATTIPSGSRVYLDDMNGFEGDVASAFAEKHVPLVIVPDKTQAQYIVSGKAEMQFQDRTDKFRAASPAAHATLTIRSAADGSIAFYAVADKRYATHGQKDTAEAIAKQICVAMRKP